MSLKKIILYGTLLFLFITVFSCEKNIHIKGMLYSQQLAFECMLLPNTVPKVYLSNSVPFFDPAVLPDQLFVRNAIVQISSSDGIDKLEPDSIFNKFKCFWVPFYNGHFEVKYGQTYTLTVIYNNKTYKAMTTLNQSKPEIKSLGYVSHFNDVYGDHEGIVVHFVDVSGQENFYRYQMGRIIDSTVYIEPNFHSTCAKDEKFYVNETGRAIYNDKNVDGQLITFVAEPAYMHKQGDTGFVKIQSIDRYSAAFYETMDRQNLAQKNPFIEPVFFKSTDNEFIGVFGSAVISDSVLFIYPE